MIKKVDGKTLIPVSVAIVLAVTTQTHLYAQSDVPLSKNVTNVFDEAGIQMEFPVGIPAVKSSSRKGVLILLHPTTPEEQAEQGYCVKINVTRLSKAELESNRQISQKQIDEFNKWYLTNHPSVDIWKQAKTWRVRKDVTTPDGLSLFIDCQVVVTKSIVTNLAEAKEIIESVKPSR